jgi:hypothetical protein
MLATIDCEIAEAEDGEQALAAVANLGVMEIQLRASIVMRQCD